MGKRPEGLRHGPGVDHGEHRDAEAPGQIGARRRAVEEAHDALDQDQIGFLGGVMQQAPALGFTGHPQIELVDRVAARDFQDHRVDKIRAGLEHPHAAPLGGVVAREARRDRGLALAGGGRAQQERRAGR
jgi:hypothetical protein